MALNAREALRIAEALNAHGVSAQMPLRSRLAPEPLYTSHQTQWFRQVKEIKRAGGRYLQPSDQPYNGSPVQRDMDMPRTPATEHGSRILPGR